MSQEEQNELAEFFMELAKTTKMTAEQQKELLEKLGSAITLNIINQLITRLPEEEKQEFQGKDFENAEAMLDFLSSKVAQEELETITSTEVEKIVNRFLDKIELLFT